MLSIRKRESGRLARLILEHCRAGRQYKLRAAMPFPQGINPPCVAVIDVDEVPRHVVENGYSTQVDLYGLVCLLLLFGTLTAFTVHVFCLFDWGWFTWLHWLRCVVFNLNCCVVAVFFGDGTLTLARRSNTSTPGCAVFLDQDFTVVVNGNQSVVEAIAESGFNLSHPNSVWRPSLDLGEESEDDGRDLSYNLLEGLCEAAYFIIFASCWLLFRQSTSLGRMAPTVVVIYIGYIFQSFPDHLSELESIWFGAERLFSRCLPPIFFFMIYEQARDESSYLALNLEKGSQYLPAFLILFFSAVYMARFAGNYPIRSAKLLDALGQPRVRKWQFDTLAAAATFQCLVLCHGITRPIRSIDVLALIDMLVPDQRDVWKAWKERVADRIVHEMEISFTPTIPTFGDERQQQLKDLLDQAQLGDDAYRRFYVWPRVPN